MKTIFSLAAFLFAPALLHAAEEVKASHILVRTQDEADIVRNEVMEKGGDRKAFMAAARKYSKDINSKRAGGALGWFTRQKMLGEFSEAAFDIKTGEVSQPVKTAYGWHLILVEDRRDQQGPQTPKPSPTPPAPAGPSDLAPGAPGQPAQLSPPAQPGGQRASPGGAQTGAQPGVKAAPPAASPTPSGNTPPAPQTAPNPQVQAPPLAPPGAATETPKVQPVKPNLPGRSLKLSIDIKQKVCIPSKTVEVDLMLANAGAEAQKVFAPDLLPLGFTVASEVAPTLPSAIWDELKSKKPETPIINLASRKSAGGSFTLNDGRYFRTGSSQRSLPSSTRAAIVAAAVH